MITISTDLAYTLLFLIGMYAFYWIFSRVMLPKIIEKNTKEIDRNPKWITNELHTQSIMVLKT